MTYGKPWNIKQSALAFTKLNSAELAKTLEWFSLSLVSISDLMLPV